MSLAQCFFLTSRKSAITKPFTDFDQLFREFLFDAHEHETRPFHEIVEDFDGVLDIQRENDEKDHGNVEDHLRRQRSGEAQA